MLKAGMCTALNKETLARLNDAGIKSVTDFLTKDLEKLSQELHIAYMDVCSIRRFLIPKPSSCAVSAVSLYQNSLSSLVILSTGCESLDNLLDGGLYTGELTEIAGDTATGKTLICMWCAAITVKSDSQSVVYIDTSSAVSTECLVSVLAEDLNRLSMNEKTEEVLVSRLKQIQYIQVYDVFDLFAALDMLMMQWSSKGQASKLVIVDNVASVMYPIMGGNIGLSQGLLSQIGIKLKQLAVEFSLAVLITNSMTSSYKGSEKKPALGKAWSHVPHTRMTISRFADPQSQDHSLRNVLLIKSARQQTPSQTVVCLKREAGTMS